MTTTKIDPGKLFNVGEPFPFIKINFEGGPGSGKSYTAGIIAQGILRRIKKTGETPKIIIVDTEQACKFWMPLLTADPNLMMKKLRPDDPNNQIFILSTDPETGKNPGLVDVCKALDFMGQGGAHIILLDSLTKIHRDFVGEFQIKKLEGRRVQFQDWAKLKQIWRDEYVSRMVNSKGHVIQCGRLANTYEEFTEGDKRTIHKTGTHMAGDRETAYEGDLNIYMERRDETGKIGKNGKPLPNRVWHIATILKSRFPQFDGKMLNLSGKKPGPDYSDFALALEFVVGDGQAAEAVERAGTGSLFDNVRTSEDDSQETITFERVEATLRDMFPVGTKDFVMNREQALRLAFDGEPSIEAIRRLPIQKIWDGYSNLCKQANEIREAKKAATPEPEKESPSPNGSTEPNMRQKMIADIHILEPKCYPIPKALDAARKKYLRNKQSSPTTELGTADFDSLASYLGHMQQKARAAAAREGLGV